MKNNLNHLADEKSPYLKQHADNPVLWYPWNSEAFDKARREDKPVFLSIGYATCHWCHVMERESFRDPEVAALLNESFVSIKVDREERPDIDHVYMTVCQLMTGTGGWPLTIMMTPDKKPFFAATYLPKQARFGRAGLLELLPQIDRLWHEKPDALERTTAAIMHSLSRSASEGSGETRDLSTWHAAFRALERMYDEQYGGFGDKPKFPQAHWLLFLLRYWKRFNEPRALEMVEYTLMQMRNSGIYDQIGFGFHRYSTDRKWRLPHFEKMLYDQALMIMAYIETYQATRKTCYADTAREVIAYVLRDMGSRGGGFFSAEDADSEGQEGAYYLWSAEEMKRMLGNDRLVMDAYGAAEDGNYRDEASGTYNGLNVLYLRRTLSSLAREYRMTEYEITEYMDAARAVLFNARQARQRPNRDEKILTDWNGLMIAALARAGSILGEPAYLRAAEQAAEFILEHLYSDKKELLHRYCDGQNAIPAHLDDYAFLAWGMIELYEATFKSTYLAQARGLMKDAVDIFWDTQSAGFFFSRNDPDLIIRQKIFYDGAIPSGNAVALHNLMHLNTITGDAHFSDIAEDLTNAYPSVAESPTAYVHFVSALGWMFGPARRIVFTGRTLDAVKPMADSLVENYLPTIAVVFASSAGDPVLLSMIPGLRDLTHDHDGPCAYVCSEDRCHAPTGDPQTMLNLLTAP